MGKGSKRRPQTVDDETMARNWADIFERALRGPRLASEVERDECTCGYDPNDPDMVGGCMCGLDDG